MSQVLTDFGKIEYKAAWLEGKLEEYLASENHLLPPARKIDMSNWPRKVHLCRYLIDSQSPFDAVIYSKELITEYYNRRLIGDKDISLASMQNSKDMVRTLRQILENRKYLQEEVIKFVLDDGVVILRHEHNTRETCKDIGFTVSWGGGDLSTCPRVVRNQEKGYDQEETVIGREECMHALKAVIKEGGLF